MEGMVKQPWEEMFCGPRLHVGVKGQQTSRELFTPSELNRDNMGMSRHGCALVELCCLEVGIRPDVATSSM